VGKVLGKKIKALRLKEGLYQSDIALEFGVAQSTVTRWENGLQDPDLRTLEKMIDYFQLTPNDLLGYSKAALELSINERQALDEFRRLDGDGQYKTIGFMRGLQDKTR